jgi:hypothetical protein
VHLLALQDQAVFPARPTASSSRPSRLAVTLSYNSRVSHLSTVAEAAVVAAVAVVAAALEALLTTPPAKTL